MSDGQNQRYFELSEVNDQVGHLSALFGRVMQIRTLLKGIYQRLDAAGHAPEQDDIDSEDVETDEDVTDEVVRDQGMFRALVDTLKEHVEEIQATGCVIKDIETGLVDWPALHDGREVLLCWKYGEPEVGFWHELSGGFAGRRPVSELEPGEQQGASSKPTR